MTSSAASPAAARCAPYLTVVVIRLLLDWRTAPTANGVRPPPPCGSTGGVPPRTAESPGWLLGGRSHRICGSAPHALPVQALWQLRQQLPRQRADASGIGNGGRWCHRPQHFRGSGDRLRGAPAQAAGPARPRPGAARPACRGSQLIRRALPGRSDGAGARPQPAGGSEGALSPLRPHLQSPSPPADGGGVAETTTVKRRLNPPDPSVYVPMSHSPPRTLHHDDLGRGICCRSTVDVFSDDPIPSYVLADEADSARHDQGAGPRSRRADRRPPVRMPGLGLRGFYVEPSRRAGAGFGRGAASLRAGGIAGGRHAGSEWPNGCFALIAKSQRRRALRCRPTPGFQDFLRSEIERTSRASIRMAGKARPRRPPSAARPGGHPARSSSAPFNPGFWTTIPTSARGTTVTTNASQQAHRHLRATGPRLRTTVTRPITCAEVTRGALCDGFASSLSVLPDSEKPR